MTDEVVEEVAEDQAELSLDDIFNGAEVEAEPEAAAETPEPEKAPEQADEDEDTEGEKPEDDASPASETAEKSVPLTAYQAERQRRQESESAKAALEQELAELKRTKEAPKPLPDPLDDAEGFASQMQAQFRKEMAENKIEMAQIVMRTVHPDYDEREAQFIVALKENPELIGKFQDAKNPALFAYETAVRLEKLSKLDNVEQTEAELRAKIEAELRQKFETESQQKAAKAKLVEDADMPSLARTGAGGMADAEVSLEQAFGGADPSQRKR